jgi:hypothetical protein
MIVRRARPHAALKRHEEIVTLIVDRCPIYIEEPHVVGFSYAMEKLND